MLPILLVAVLVFGWVEHGKAQCNNPDAWATNNAPTAGNAIDLTTCLFAGEYTTVNAVAATTSYTATSSIGSDFITIRQGTPGGTVIASGTSPLNWTSTVAGTYYIHLNTNSTCGFESTCRTLNLAALNIPCSGTPNAGTATISSATGCTGQNFTLSASGLSTGSGLTFQWQSAPSASGPWTNMAGGTSATFSTTVASAGQTFYQLISTCSGVSSTSNAVSFTASSCGIVPTSGVGYITATCGMPIYDSGGASGDYSNNESGTLIIRPPSMTDVISVSGTCTLRNNDFLMLDEGEESNNLTYISQYTGTTANQVVTTFTASGPGIPIVIHFTSNGSNVNPGFALTVSCECAKPSAITLTAPALTDCNSTSSITVNSVSTTWEPWVMTTFQNDALPALSWLPTSPNAWISGSANLQNANNNQVELTPNTNSQNGALVFESFGKNRTVLDAWFDIYAGGGSSADGIAFSYGPSITSTNPVGGNYENYVGSGLAISFDSFNSGAIFPNCNGTNYQNIYLIYNGTTIACYTTFNSTFWRTYLSNVNVFVNTAGQLTMTVLSNGITTTVFNAVQLPAAYVSANKSTWRAAFTARTGGSTDQHRVDNVNIYHTIQDFEYSLNGTTWQASNVFSGLAAGTYTVYVRYKNFPCSFSQSVTITGFTASTAPTSITGTNSICNGSSTTLTTAGGTLGTDAEDYWYEGQCPTECYTQEWGTQPFPVQTTTQNSVSGGILNVTSTSGDAGINMTSVGSIAAASCRWISIRYRVTAGTGGLAEIYFSKTGGTDLSEAQVVRGNLVSDGQWNILNIDMGTNANWNGTITGWRYDWCTNTGVTMDIDFITLSNTPILSQGSSITVSPTTNTTYFTLKKGPCNTTTCVSQLVSVTNVPTVATVGGTQNFCGTLTSTGLGGNTPTSGTGSWSIVSGGTGTFSSASNPNATFTADAYGTYVLRWTIANSPCNPSTADVTVNFYQTPTTATVGATQTICNSLTSNALGGNTPAVGTGTWTIVSGGTGTFNPSATTPGATFTANALGNYVLQWTISNGTCTSSSATINVNFFNASAPPTITGPTTYCAGSSVTLTASGGASYVWSTTATTTAITVSPVGSTSYTVTATDGNGCTATATQNLSSTALPTAPTVSAVAPSICAGANAVFTISGTAGLNVTYSGVTGTPTSPATIGAGGSVTITVPTTVASTQTITLVSASDGTCSVTTSANATVTVNTCATINECDILVYEIGNNATATTSAPVTILQFPSNFTNTTTPARLTAPVTSTNNLTNISGGTTGDANSILTGYMNTNNGIVALPGYSDASGTTTLAASSDNERVNLFNASQVTTAINASGLFTGNPSFIRGAVAVDATRFYCFGAGTTQATSGIFYWNGTSFTQIFTDAGCVQGQATNIRSIDIFNGQLYMLRKSGTTAPVNILFAVGNGLPTALITTTTLVTNYGTSTANSPISFSISPDGTTMYSTDNSSFTANGITKWIKSSNGGVFNRVNTSATIQQNATNNTTPTGVGNSASATANKYMGIAVDWNANPVKIYATSSTSGANGGAFLVALTESGGIGTNAANWATVGNVQFYNATNNSCTGCKYTGVDLAPSITANFTAGVNTTVSPFTACVNNPITVTASAIQTTVNNALTYQWYKYTSSAAYVDYYGAVAVTGADGTGGTTATFTPTVAGNYFCEINGGSCAKYRTPPVIVSSTLPTVSATVGACSGATADVTVTASGATAGYNISWTGPATGNPVGTEIATSGGTYPITALGNGSYTITALSANGCSASTTATVSCGSTCTNPTIDTQPANITECLNAAQQLSVTASGTALTYQWYSNTSASNTGGTLLTGETNATYTPPSGTAGTFYYYVIVYSSTCETTSNAVTVVVNPNNTAGTPSSSPTVCLGTAISPDITITTTGATGIGAATGLPTGVSANWSANTITISGTPTASGTFNYSIPLTGGCGTVNATGTITVTDNNTAGTPSSSPTVCLGTAISPNITITTTGATGIGAATGLPTGVSANWSANTITISGTPTASGTFNYSIPLTGGCGTVNATGTITVTDNNTAGTPSSSPTVCLGTAISPDITITTTGATGIGAATGLPTGVSANWSANTITISGTPTASGTFNYSIPLTGGCGTVNATGTITVTDNNTAGTPSSSPTVCLGTAISPDITITTTGATGIGAATGLPTGVSANWSANTITISGTPTASGTFNYSIPLTGGCGTVNATGTITVTDNNTAGTPSSSPTVCLGTAISPNITITTTGATGIGAATGLPTGVSANWSANTITISGTPTASGTFNYSIPLTGGCGTVNATGTITVTDNNTAGTPSSSPTVCLGTAISPDITITTTGATGIGAATGLPTGVSANWSANTITISGTPTASGTFNYSIPLTGGCGTVNATGTITVSDIIDWVNLQWPPNGSICQGGTFDIYGQLYNTGAISTVGAGVAAAGVTVEYGYSTTDTNPATWTNWSTATFNPGGGGTNNDEYMGTFSGLAPGTYYYTFRYQINGCGWQYGGYSAGGGDIWNGTTYVSGVLTVNPNPTAGITGNLTFCQGTTTTLTATGGGTYSWSPGGANTAQITVSTANTYTVTVTVNGCQDTESVTVTQAGTSVITNVTP